MSRRDIPIWLLAGCVFMLGLMGFFKHSIEVSDFILATTLSVLVLYTYYTYCVAETAWTPCASCLLEVKEKKGGYEFLCFVRNYSKMPLECWSKVRADIGGKRIYPNHIAYNAEVPWRVQPLGEVMGHFSLQELLSKAGITYEQLKKDAQQGDDAECQVKFCIDFWYHPTKRNKTVTNPQLRYHFDLNRKALIFDV